MEVDIACVGFGPAMGGFLTTLSRGLVNPDGTPVAESAAMPGMPPMVVCYERADDLGFGVSGVVTRARGIRATFPDLDPAQIPLATPVTGEKLVYLLDPVGASRRSLGLRLGDRLIRSAQRVLPFAHSALELPYTPPFLHKAGGLVLSIGQFNQWVGMQLMGSGLVQLWPATPVAAPLFEGDGVVGIRLLDQGTDREGNPGDGFMPGMDIRAALTVLGDGPVGAVGRQVDEHFGMPEDHHRRDWALGTKMVVELREDVDLPPGTVIHTFGYPEPEIFGFLYVHPDRLASVGIFLPSCFDSPVPASYRYLQHFMMHPYLWRYLEGGTLRSWGAKSLEESGRRGEPFLARDGCARIGEGSGSTNVLTGSGVDEAWATGVQLAEAVLRLLREGKPFTRENLEATYVAARRESWVESEGRVAERSRHGFQRGVLTGLVGMALAGLTGGRVAIGPEPKLPHQRARTPKDRLPMDAADWPPIPHDDTLLISHQDALLLGGKVQAAPGYADHVIFVRPELCQTCETRVCVEICSGQAITPGEAGVPVFDREKCVHCGACYWSCAQTLDGERTNIEFRAGAGGLHSPEN
ncbi:MAG: 4Fe-4S ferredoxin [Deltaproteobacteria bacterium]|nr:4Fe-4S ferredoxin [Deltaproteobacteria bacterium]